MLFGKLPQIAGIGIFHIEKFKKWGRGRKRWRRASWMEMNHMRSRPCLDPDSNTTTEKRKLPKMHQENSKMYLLFDVFLRS